MAKSAPKTATSSAVVTRRAGTEPRPTLRLLRTGQGDAPTPVGQPGNAAPARPFFKWVGGKTRLLSQLDRLLPTTIGRYAEPFMGGAAMFFHLRNDAKLTGAVLTDFNRDVVNVFEVVRDHSDALLAALRRHQALYLTRDADGRAAYFYAIRGQHPDEGTDAVDRAARMLFLNRTCFNGLWRENRSGRFNTPHGRYANPVIAPTAKIQAASAALQLAHVERSDFRDIPRLCRDHQVDFVYMDPPYHPISATSAFNAYSQGGFSGKAQAELADVCRELDRMNVRFMLSNSDCPLIRELYDAFDIRTVMAPRAVNCKGNKRGAVAEVVVRNTRSGLTW